jgi:hypothetical protein
MRYPNLLCLRQRFETHRVNDVSKAVLDALASCDLGAVAPGDEVAVAVGSRGITNLPTIVRTLVSALRERGARPFLVPAMGSHGGGSADGQRRVLEGYGLGEEALGVPIRAGMETTLLGETADGIPIHIDRIAAEAPHLVIVNRVKPHTSFAGQIESGLLKMLMIGLGNHVGATVYHRAIVTHTFDRIVRSVGSIVLDRSNVRFGLAILEDAADQTALIEAVAPQDFERRERELLEQARRWMPRLPLDRIDLLIVDEMGKDVSGQGMDTNVTGRKAVRAAGMPEVTRLFVRALTSGSHGNAHGIGQADFATTRLVEAIDRRVTAINSITAVNPARARIPIHFDTDREAIDAALSTIGLVAPEAARIVRIRNTLKLEVVEVSEPCLAEIAQRRDLEVLRGPYPFAFDTRGDLVPISS